MSVRRAEESELTKLTLLAAAAERANSPHVGIHTNGKSIVQPSPSVMGARTRALKSLVQPAAVFCRQPHR